VKVGLITVPADNILTSKPEKRFIPEVSYNIIAYQTKPFTFTINTEIGKKKLKIYVLTIRDPKRPHIWKCIDCGIEFNFENQFQCKKHFRPAPQLKLRVSGLKEPGLPSKVDILSDLDFNLLSLNNIYFLKKRMEDEIQKGTFNIWRYLPRKKKKFLFENHAKTYIDDLEGRTKLNHDDSERCSIAHYSDVMYSFKNHLIPFFKDCDIADIANNPGLIKDFLKVPLCPKPVKKKQGFCGKTLEKWKCECKDKKSCKCKCKGKCSCGWEGLLNDVVLKSSHQKRKYNGYLRTYFKWAKKRRDITTTPEFDTIKLNRKKKHGLSFKVQQEIFEKIPDKHKLIFRWIREEGRRPGEAPALKVIDVDFDKPYYFKGELIGHGVYCYTGSFDRNNYVPYPKVRDMAGDECPLSNEARDILKKALFRVPKPDEDDFVFINPGTGKVYTYDDLLDIFHEARKKAGHQVVELNTWGRHTKAQTMLEDGFDAKFIANRLGDKDGETILKSYATSTAGYKAGVEMEIKKKNEAKIINLSERKGQGKNQ